MKARSEFKNDEEYREYLRIYFAAKAMQGMMNGAGVYANGDCHADRYAKDAVVMADALIKQLNPANQS